MRKSEPSIVVSIPGNAGGAKGWRFEITCGRYTALHSEDSVRDNIFCAFHLVGVPVPSGEARQRRASLDAWRLKVMGLWACQIEEDSNWEPDGVTLQVRFCEEPGTNRRMAAENGDRQRFPLAE